MATEIGNESAAVAPAAPITPIAPTPAGDSVEFVTVDVEAVMREAATTMPQLRKMLEDEPFRFRFFQAVRLLQRLTPNREPVGYFSKPEDEVLRFSSLPSLSFPPSDLYDLQTAPSGQIKMTVQFMGLCAALSALPTMYVEMVLSRIREKDRAMAEFFDIFDHRLLSLFYRAWEKHHYFVGYEAGTEDKLTLRLLDMIGLGTEGLRGRSVILDETCVFYAGLLGRSVRTASGLRQILEDFFGVTVEVHQFAGTWRPLPRENQTFLSGFGGVSEQLGFGVVAGEEVWDHHGRIRITFGPLKFEQYQEFLPGKQAHRELSSFMKFYSDGAYETLVQLILRREDVPVCELGSRSNVSPKLGLVSWLKTKPRARDADEATFLLPG